MFLRSVIILVLSTALATAASAQNELRFYLHGEPASLNPLDVRDEFSDFLRYLTSAVLVRLNRATQQPEPALATGWNISADGRQFTFDLRTNVRFSDGSPFDAADVVHTFRLLMAPELHSAVADSFRFKGKEPTVTAVTPLKVRLSFAQAVPGLLRLLDQVSIVSSRSSNGNAVAGPYFISGRVSGVSLKLTANPNYWKRDAAGHQLPKIREISISVQKNRELEALALRRGEIDVMSNIDSRTYAELAGVNPLHVADAGPSLDQEFLWFNQTHSPTLAAEKRSWFTSREFRNAVSLAINRSDICRVVYQGHAVSAVGPYPASNRLFFNSQLKQRTVDVARARLLLKAAGFSFDGSVLRDRKGNAVRFTVLTNADSRTRNQMAALIQRDLKAIGIEMNIVSLDFMALVEKIVKTYNYDACLLGTVGVNVDPATDMDIWTSSGPNHMWNPKQASPETTWESEIDTLMLKQASTVDEKARKAAFDRVQEILYEQEPVLYLVHPNALGAVSPRVRGIKPAVLRPQLLWNVDSLELASQ